MHTKTIAALAALASLFAFAAPGALAQDVSLVGGAPVVQTFDSLAASGTGSTLPSGWYFKESGSNANTSYTAGDGSTNAGDTYSYGATGSSERALGALRSSKVTTVIGARLRNDTTNTLDEIMVAYTGEQWRRGESGAVDRLDFQYSLNATSLTDTAATWVDVNALDFNTPNTSAPAASALDGNASANRTSITGSITGLGLAPSGTIWVRWTDFDVASSDDGLAIDDVSFSVDGTPPPDVAPFVVATVPGDNANDVSASATLAVSFSEPVAVTAPWYTIQCAISGTHTASVSGGTSAYTLTPSPAFAANESCTWTILASGVVDLDSTPDHPDADHVVHFTTIDPATQPPSVVSTSPTNGAVNVPVASDVRVTFSEAVTTTQNAFALTCGGAPVQLAESGSGATRTLTPFTVLPTGASCVFTIHASDVHDGDGIALTADYTATFTVASGTLAGYYDRVNTSSPEQLRCSLHQTIKGHTVYPYSGNAGPQQQNTWTILEIAQQDPNNPNKIIDIYRNHSYTAITDRAGSGGSNKYNREHTWPNSLGFKNDSLAAYTDTHMLWLADENQNSKRGNKPLANCRSGCTELQTDANNGVGGPGQSNWYKTPDGNAGSFEVWDHRKGEIARAMFYMAIRYEGIASEAAHDGIIPDLELTDDRSKIVVTANTAPKAYMGLLTDLLAWNEADPPDAEEVARNDVIQSFQGNRNPFVDHPEWATRALFDSSEPASCELVQPNDTIFENGFDLAH